MKQRIRQGATGNGQRSGLVTAWKFGIPAATRLDAVMHHNDSIGCGGYPEQKKNLRLDAILPKADIP
jgi:hypothetical protein